MRKLFIGTMLTSLLGAFVIGGVLAWTGSATGSSSASSGEVAFTISGYVQTGNLVVPTATNIKVADGGITNTGDVTVHVTGGSVAVTSYVGGGSPGACGVSGSVVVTNPGDIAPTTSFAPLYDVFLNMPTTAGDACQNNTINYDLTINVAT